MTENKTYTEIIKEVEQETGEKVTKQKADFALHHFTNPDNQSESARESGYKGEHAGTRGNQLANDSKVKALIEKLKAEIGDPNDVEIEALVTQTLVNEMLTAEASRDRINAAEKLGKIYGMFKDVVEHIDTRTNEQMLTDIEKTFGIVARRNAEKQLGLT